MYRALFLRTAGVALAFYGVIGIFVVAATVLVGTTAFSEIARSRVVFNRERTSVVDSLRTLSRTFADASAATGNFEQSLNGARDSANSASRLAADTATSFRGLALSVQLDVFGIQPFGGLAPQFDQSAAQLDELSSTLRATQDSLGQNSRDILRVGADLAAVQRQVTVLADTLAGMDLLAASGQQALLPLQVAFFGLCLLLGLQSLFALVAGLALLRYASGVRTRVVGVIEQVAPPPGSAPPTSNAAPIIRRGI